MSAAESWPGSGQWHARSRPAAIACQHWLANDRSRLRFKLAPAAAAAALDSATGDAGGTFTGTSIPQATKFNLPRKVCAFRIHPPEHQAKCGQSVSEGHRHQFESSESSHHTCLQVLPAGVLKHSADGRIAYTDADIRPA